MVNENYTHIKFVVDRSGSMHSSKRRMTDAMNEFLDSQAKLEGKCLVDYATFDTQYTLEYEDRHILDAEAFINPRGGTALLDAIGKATNELGSKLRHLRESARPGKVLVVVVTDGMENSSVEFTPEAVKQLVRQQEDTYNWEYLFLGANIDAVAVGDLYGFKLDNSLTFDINDAAAVGATSAALTNYATTYRGGGKAAFSAEEREKAVGK